MRYAHIWQYVTESPWAILPAKLAVIVDLIAYRAEGHRLTAEEIQERIGAAAPRTVQSQGSVAVLPLVGTISQRMGLMSEMSGGVSTERFAAMFRQAMSDPSVGSIVLDVDSPGGSVYGVDELSGEIYRARGSKPVVAVANSLAVSAAYWIATAADEVVVTPGGEVGSIGVLAAHEDLSRMLDSTGVTVSLISAGKYKAEGSPFAPLDAEARSAVQRRVDEYYSLFTRAVARNRGVGVDAVRSGFGEGRVVSAAQAVKLGMADKVGTLAETVDRLSRSRRSKAQMAAELDARRRRIRALAY